MTWKLYAQETQRHLQTMQRSAALLTPLSVFRDPLKSGGEGPEMVVIPAGSFLMGSLENELERNENEGSQTQITLQPFALGKYAVTFDEYDQYYKTVGGDRLPRDSRWGRGRHPVINVNVDDVEAYCAWLSAQTGAEYRLPSEAEWEHACRAGSMTPFEPTVAHSHEGRTITPDEANYDGEYIYNGGPKGAYREKTVLVDFEQFRPNAWGLWQMHGNVWEWMGDCWNGSYVGCPTDDSASLSEDYIQNIIRGGSWGNSPQVLRAAYRGWLTRKNWNSTIGFRVARTLL